MQDLKTLYCLSVIWSENIVSKVKCFRSVKGRRNIWSKVKCLSIAGSVKRQPFGTLPVIRPVSLPPTLHYFSPKHFSQMFYQICYIPISINKFKEILRFYNPMFYKIFALSHFHLHSTISLQNIFFSNVLKCSTNLNLVIHRNFISQDLIAQCLT